RSSRDFHFPPPLVGATPFWLAARFTQPGMMRLLVKHGADPLVVHHSSYVLDNLKSRTEATAPLLAAMGMGGGTAWVQPASGQRESLALETVRLMVELGADVNAANAAGRTALSAARALHYESVVKLLMAKGAR
ncbi:MAG TPA: ankyrin repeat domain-containing protein, partial [Bryobacteraceae bacterium]|nr:ankyrin repeat domain-containing protein [Bryobacteraceae bacterium]